MAGNTSGRREQEYRTSPPGVSSRRHGRLPGSDSGFESLDGEYRSPPANYIPPPFTDADVARQWNSLPNLQTAYRELWEKCQHLTKKHSGEFKALSGEVKALSSELKDAEDEINRLKGENGKLQGRVQKLQEDKDSITKAKNALTKDYDVMRNENLALKREKGELQGLNAHLKATCSNLELQLDELRPSSESSSSKHQRSQSSATKKDKIKEKDRSDRNDRDQNDRNRNDRSARERVDKDRSREKRERDREPAKDSTGLEHLKERFERPSAATDQPSRSSRRMSMSYHENRPSVHVQTASYEPNYQVSSPPLMTPTSAYPANVPRQVHPAVTVPIIDSYASYVGPDGNYHQTPLPREPSRRS